MDLNDYGRSILERSVGMNNLYPHSNIQECLFNFMHNHQNKFMEGFATFLNAKFALLEWALDIQPGKSTHIIWSPAMKHTLHHSNKNLCCIKTSYSELYND